MYRYGPRHEDPESSRGGLARECLAAGRLQRGGRRCPDAGGVGGLGGHGGVRIGVRVDVHRRGRAHPDGGALPEGWPAEAPPEHGARVWAVYLAVGPEGDPALADAAEWLQARGYSTFEGRDSGCHGGAAEAIGRDPRELAVTVYFDWRADAGDFLTLLKPPGSTPETTRTFVEMLRVTRDCVS